MLKKNVVYENMVVYVDWKTFSTIFLYFDDHILGFGEYHNLSGFVVMNYRHVMCFHGLLCQNTESIIDDDHTPDLWIK